MLIISASITGGNITLEDLSSYHAPVEDPSYHAPVEDPSYHAPVEDPLMFRLNNGNFTLLSPQPPSGGIVVGHILNIGVTFLCKWSFVSHRTL